MSVITALYTLLIRPLELLFEYIYVIANRFIHNPGLSIIALSLAMNFLVLPLYKRADAMQAEQRDTEARLNPWVTRINKAFTGDKRFMILQEYYRQNHYKPTYALRGSLSLLLEIPFFIAAYRFLSGLELLKGVSFGPLTDLGALDALIHVAGISVNLLPVLMTLINIISGAVYTKGMPAKTKIQLYAMALVFLVFLYDSPAGLVFYWTLNNVFSLLKNIFYKLKNPRRVLFILAAAVGVATVLLLGIVYAPAKLKRRLLFIAAGLALQLPLILDLIATKRQKGTMAEVKKADRSMFFIPAAVCAVLTGILIPSAVIESAPAELIDMTHYSSPLGNLWYSGLLAVGTFVIWAGLFYYLTSEEGKEIFGKVYFALACVFLFNYMVYGKGQSNLSASLQYEKRPGFSMKLQIVSMLFAMAVLLAAYLLADKLPKLTNMAGVVGMLAVIVMSGMNIDSTVKTLNNDLNYINKQADTARIVKENGLIHLSKTGKNVVVIMLDRAMGCYIPFIMEEKPELTEQFDGFTFYHNAMSFGRSTAYGAFAMMGGYEYTPEAINARKDETLLKKANEANKLMPVLFSQNGFKVTVCDPPLAGLEYIPDLTIYDDYPEIQAYMLNKRLNLVDNSLFESTEKVRQRNFFCFSIMKIAPLALQNTLYNNGLYNEGNAGNGEKSLTVQVKKSISKAYGLSSTFMNTYSVMHSLSDLTRVEEDQTNQFFFMCNEMTHDVMLLQKPDYVPSPTVDNTEYDQDIQTRYQIDGIHMLMTSTNKVAHYDSNMCAMIQLANWFDYLRKEGVYDNTRIILVSDHGGTMNQFKQLEITENFDAQEIACLLMVKDFNARGALVTSEEFMTNADTPILAMQDLINDPVNPFTGKKVNADEKTAHPQVVLDSKTTLSKFRKGKIYPGGEWYSVHDSIWEKTNWVHVKSGK